MKRQDEEAEKTDRMITKRMEEVRVRINAVEKIITDEKERVTRNFNMVKKEAKANAQNIEKHAEV